MGFDDDGDDDGDVDGDAGDGDGVVTSHGPPSSGSLTCAVGVSDMRRQIASYAEPSTASTLCPPPPPALRHCRSRRA